MFHIKLGNFRRFKDLQEFTFAPGLTIVVGPNGAGKSTLVEAITCALFGYDGAGGSKARDVRSDEADGDTVVECRLTVDDRIVNICRNGKQVSLTVAGVERFNGITGRQREDKKEFDSLLGGMSAEQFQHTYLAVQGDAAGLADSKKAKDRRHIIESVLQMDVVREAVELQRGNAVRARATLDTAMDRARKDLKMEAEANDVLTKFRDAKSLDSWLTHAQTFLGHIGSVVGQRRAAAEKAAADVADADDNIGQLEQEWEAAKEAKDQARRAQQAQEALEEKYRALGNDVSEARGQRQSYEQQIEDKEESVSVAKTHEEDARRYDELAEQIGAVNKRLNYLPTVKVTWERYAEAKGAVDGLEVELGSLGDVDAAYGEAVTRREKAEAAKRNLESDPTAEETELWLARKAAFDHEREGAEQARTALIEGGDAALCPTCGQPLDEQGRAARLADLERLLHVTLPVREHVLAEEEGILNGLKVQRQREREQADREYEDAINAVATAEAAKDKRDNLQERLCGARYTERTWREAWEDLHEPGFYSPEESSRLQQKRKGLEEAAAELDETAQMFKDIGRLEHDIAYLEGKRRDADDALQCLLDAQERLRYDADAHTEAKAAYSGAERAERDASDTLSQTREARTNLKGQADAADSRRVSAENEQTEVREAIAAWEREARLYGIMAKFRDRYFSSSTGELSRRASELLQYAITDQTITGLEFEDENLYYLDTTGTRRSAARLSGGEKALVGLALRLALAELAHQRMPAGRVRVLVLDEVLSSLDGHRLNAVQEMLDGVLSRGVFEHIILITHLDAVKTQWRAAMLEVRKADGDNRYSVLVPPDGHYPFLDMGDVSQSEVEFAPDTEVSATA